MRRKASHVRDEGLERHELPSPFLYLRDEPDPVGGWGEITLAARLARLVHPVNQTTVLLGQRFSQTDFWTLPLRRQRVQTRRRFV